MSTTKSTLEEWVSEFSGKYCRNCPDSCCNGTRQLINIDLNALELFQEAGIPHHLIGDLDERSVLKWLIDGMRGGLFEKSGSHFIGDVYFRDGRIVKKPAIILTPRIEQCGSKGIEFGIGHTYVLYVEKYCPFFDEESGCKVYGNPKRPNVCKSYPLNVEGDKDNLRVTFHKWCPSSLEGIAEIRQKFPDIDVERL